MRRLALLANMTLLPGLAAGCAHSGFYAYQRDTLTLPGANPNIAPGNSEDYKKTKIGSANAPQPTPILFEAGDVWPGPPKAPPTLKDLQRQQNQEISNGGSGYAPLAPLPQLPGFEVPQQEPRRAAPAVTFPGGIVPMHGGTVNGNNRTLQPLQGPANNGSIVVPNGNGTSTVIGPNGTVSTIPTPGK